MKTVNMASGMIHDSGEPRARQHLHPSSRIEDIVIVREANTPNNFGQKGYLRFENVTMVRLDFFLYAADADPQPVPDTQKPNRSQPTGGFGEGLGKLISSRGL